jgi:two-component system CheB/CheR fusion protein
MAAKKRSRSHSAEEISDSKETAAQVVDEKAVPGFPIVGIGASAGGLAAFETFFSAMPADIGSDMAFVLVQHLAPDYKSILSELVRRYTRMQVLEVEDGMMVKANCVYIIPPNRDMAYLNGTLQLLEPQAPRVRRLPIDFFFRSLAQDQHERAIGIVLSGTGSDGTIGVRDIKEEGGMVMAPSSPNPQNTMVCLAMPSLPVWWITCCPRPRCRRILSITLPTLLAKKLGRSILHLPRPKMR